MAIKQTEQREAAFKHVANILHSSINRSADAEQLESRHPAFSDNLLSFVPAQSEAQFNLDTKIIPIVFHVIHDGHQIGEDENISVEQIEDVVSIMNEDFSASNPDLENVIDEFDNIIGAYCLVL